MIKPVFAVITGLSIALTMACSPSSDETAGAPAPAASEAPNLAAIHADDTGEKIPVTLENY